MSKCNNCQHRFSVHAPLPAFCPRCGTEVSAGGDSRWVSIARLTNLAEVGYFADTLEAEGITTQVRQHNEFSALHGTWQTVFVLQVPARHGSQAAQRLRRDVEQTAEEEAVAVGNHTSSGALLSEQHSVSSVAAIWKPVVFVLLAGGLFCTTRQVDRGRPNRLPQDVTPLWEALTETSRILTSDVRPGQPSSRLLTDPRSRTIWLQDDVDGDGRFDRVRCFREGKLNGQVGR